MYIKRQGSVVKIIAYAIKIRAIGTTHVFMFSLINRQQVMKKHKQHSGTRNSTTMPAKDKKKSDDKEFFNIFLIITTIKPKSAHS